MNFTASLSLQLHLEFEYRDSFRMGGSCDWGSFPISVRDTNVGAVTDEFVDPFQVCDSFDQKWGWSTDCNSDQWSI